MKLWESFWEPPRGGGGRSGETLTGSLAAIPPKIGQAIWLGKEKDSKMNDSRIEAQFHPEKNEKHLVGGSQQCY